eukprot:c8182_g1_i1.p1 GENE.c8182_g1_i1~~c8182_g1_i1.p1  ORF type:complete len:211 (+),score=52.16 c8182_g1_i1:21-653(+)
MIYGIIVAVVCFLVTKGTDGLSVSAKPAQFLPYYFTPMYMNMMFPQVGNNFLMPHMGMPVNRVPEEVQPNLVLHTNGLRSGTRARVILRYQNAVLMGLARKSSKWGIPGGHLEKGETRLAGLERELKEETAINLSDTEDLTEIGYDPYSKTYWYTAKLKKVDYMIHPYGDKDYEFQWLRLFKTNDLPSNIYADAKHYIAVVAKTFEIQNQ